MKIFAILIIVVFSLVSQSCSHLVKSSIIDVNKTEKLSRLTKVLNDCLNINRNDLDYIDVFSSHNPEYYKCYSYFLASGALRYHEGFAGKYKQATQKMNANRSQLYNKPKALYNPWSDKSVVSGNFITNYADGRRPTKWEFVSAEQTENSINAKVRFTYIPEDEKTADYYNFGEQDAIFILTKDGGFLENIVFIKTIEDQEKKIAHAFGRDYEVDQGYAKKQTLKGLYKRGSRRLDEVLSL